jgi:hypothetical protein
MELVEADPHDKKWGIGFLADVAEFKQNEWGRNLLGIVLMTVREKLLKLQNASDSNPDEESEADAEDKESEADADDKDSDEDESQIQLQPQGHKVTSDKPVPMLDGAACGELLRAILAEQQKTNRLLEPIARRARQELSEDCEMEEE